MKNKNRIKTACFPSISKTVLMFLMAFTTFLFAQEEPVRNLGDFVENRVILRIADDVNVGRSGRSVITLETVGDFLGVEFKDIRLLNPAPENPENNGDVRLARSASGNQNTTLLLTLQ